MSEVLAIGGWSSNAELIADVARLGYLPEPVCDLTYGAGGFWKQYEPGDFTKNDLHPERGVTHEDFRRTTFDAGQFATVVFDPPYKLQGTPASGEMDDRYGTEVVRSRAELLSLLVGGIAEATRISNKFVLVKVMDQVNGGKVRWLTTVAHDTARSLEWRQVDEFHLLGGRPQPAGRSQEHARRNHSTLMVFKRGLS